MYETYKGKYSGNNKCMKLTKANLIACIHIIYCYVIYITYIIGYVIYTVTLADNNVYENFTS